MLTTKDRKIWAIAQHYGQRHSTPPRDLLGSNTNSVTGQNHHFNRSNSKSTRVARLETYQPGNLESRLIARQLQAENLARDQVIEGQHHCRWKKLLGNFKTITRKCPTWHQRQVASSTILRRWKQTTIILKMVCACQWASPWVKPLVLVYHGILKSGAAKCVCLKREYPGYTKFHL